jgi:multiple sugar transport system substrate-binding protein
MNRSRLLHAAAFAAAAAVTAAPAAHAQQLLFWSTQANPVEEAQAMRDQVLAGFDGSVDFQPQQEGPFMTRIQAELEAGSGQIDVIGALHGSFASFPNGLSDLSTVVSGLSSPASAGYVDLGKLGTGEQKYVPWMQATFIMAANKQALQYLPAGADINALTYDQVIAWGKAMADATGGPKLGIPAGPQGLIHRFVQGSLYPSFTNSMVTKFRSPEAEAMWNKVKELWAVTNPSSTNYGFMQEPLLTGEVWVAWDHIARLADAFNQKPDDFVAFPSPAGPTGRGFMPVIAGLGVPVTAPNKEAADRLVAYMMKPETQIATLRATNFYPVVAVDLPADMPNSVKMSGPAIAAQANAPDANPGLLPIGLGAAGGEFNQVYRDTFERILLAGQNVRTVLDEQAAALRAIIDKAGAPCWAPDPASTGPCPIE